MISCPNSYGYKDTKKRLVAGLWLLAVGCWLESSESSEPSERSELSEWIGTVGAIRPLAVGRLIAPSRRGYAPNDWG